MLAGGEGNRLKQLTDDREKPAVHFGNSSASSISSLQIASTPAFAGSVWSPSTSPTACCVTCSGLVLSCAYQMNEFIELLPAQQRVDEVSWYRLYTADTVYQNLDIIRQHGPKYVIVLAGSHLQDGLRRHAADTSTWAAARTVACIEVPRQEASAFGVMAVDGGARSTPSSRSPPTRRPCRGAPTPRSPPWGSTSSGRLSLPAAGRGSGRRAVHHDFGMDVIRGWSGRHRLCPPFSMSCVGCGNSAPTGATWGTVDSFWGPTWIRLGDA